MSKEPLTRGEHGWRQLEHAKAFGELRFAVVRDLRQRGDDVIRLAIERLRVRFALLLRGCGALGRCGAPLLRSPECS